MQDGAPIDWLTNASNWLNENLPGRWNGRGGAQDCNITWPLKADRNEATLPRNYCMQPCNPTSGVPYKIYANNENAF